VLFPKEFISPGVKYDIPSDNIIITHLLQEIICCAIFFQEHRETSIYKLFKKERQL